MVGEIRLYAGLKPPKRWLFCNGQWLSQAAYSELFRVVGTRFGYRYVDYNTYYDEWYNSYNPNDPNTWDYGDDHDEWLKPVYESKVGMFRLPNLKSPIVDFWAKLKPEIRPGNIEVPGYSRTFPNWTPRERVVGHLRREDEIKYIIRYEDDPIDTKKHRKFFNMMYDLRHRNRHTD